MIQQQRKTLTIMTNVILSNGNNVKFRKFENSKGFTMLQMVNPFGENVSIRESELSDELDVLDSIKDETNFKKDLCVEILNHFKSI